MLARTKTLVFLPALALGACIPNNAELTSGTFVAFMANSTSLSLAQEKVVPEDFDVNYNVDCREEFIGGDDLTGVELLEPKAQAVCDQGLPNHEEWYLDEAFRVVSEPLDAWRGEALINAEGDLQITFHHTLEGGADFRFTMAVDPAFQPVTCSGDENGDLVRTPIDGDWVENWSSELDWVAGLTGPDAQAYDHIAPYADDGRLYFLNARSYQINPLSIGSAQNDDPSDDDRWPLPDQWAAGAAVGEFSEEEISQRLARYADPAIYNLNDASIFISNAAIAPSGLWVCRSAESPITDDTATDPCMLALQDRVRNTALEIRSEMEVLMTPPGANAPVMQFAPITHANLWRDRDDEDAGLDGWGELHYNYIVFSGDSELEEGGFASGGFNLTLDGTRSGSRVYLKGEFVIDSIKGDRFTTDRLALKKAEENGNELCNEH